MNLRNVVLIIALFFSITAYGQSAPQKNQAVRIQELETENEQLQKELDKVYNEVDVLKDKVDFVRSNYEVIDQHNWNYIEQYYDRISILLTLLAIIVAISSIFFPIVINRKHDERMQEQIDSASKEAEEAKKYLGQVNTLKDEINSIKEQIQKDKEASAEAAKQSKISELLSRSFQEKDPKISIEYLNSVLQLDPDNAVAYNNRGAAKSDLGDKEGAIRDYNRAIELEPDDAAAYYNRGVDKSELGDKAGAIRDYDRAIELKPDYAAAYNNRGVDKSALGDKEGAIRDYNIAIELKPDNAKYYDKRAALYREIAEQEEDETQKAELVNLAEKDEAKSKELNSKN